MMISLMEKMKDKNAATTQTKPDNMSIIPPSGNPVDRNIFSYSSYLQPSINPAIALRFGGPQGLHQFLVTD